MFNFVNLTVSTNETRMVTLNTNDTGMEALYSRATRITTLVFCIIMYIVGTTGNILIIWTFVRIKQQRIRQNIFVVLLAVVDFLIIGYLLPFNMHVMISNKRIDKPILCKVNALTGHVLFTCSVQFIMYIALCRYTKICHAGRFDQIFPLRRILLLSASSFISGLIFGLPLLVNDNFLIFDRTLHLCLFNRYGNLIYSYIYMGICLFVPVSVTSLCYLKIYFYVRKSKLKLYQHCTNPLARRRLSHELNVTRSQFSVFIAYLVFYMPFGITATIRTSAKYFPDEFHTLAMYLCFTNSCINSILYGILNTNMRKAYKESLSCNTRTRNGQQSSQSTTSDNRSVIHTGNNSSINTTNSIINNAGEMSIETIGQISVA